MPQGMLRNVNWFIYHIHIPGASLGELESPWGSLFLPQTCSSCILREVNMCLLSLCGQGYHRQTYEAGFLNRH